MGQAHARRTKIIHQEIKVLRNIEEKKRKDHARGKKIARQAREEIKIIEEWRR